MKLELKKAVLGDESVLGHIQSESWRSAFGEIISAEDMARCADPDSAEKMYKNVLKTGRANMTILYADGVAHCIAGWSKNRDELGESVAELICIHSLADKRRMGCGSAMMEHVLGEIAAAGYREIVLWVFEKNSVARLFYEKHGFNFNGVKREAFGATEMMYSKVI